MLLCALALPVAPRAAHAQDNATFVSQSVPSSMLPGKVYSVSVTMQNTGTENWVFGGSKGGATGHLLYSYNAFANTRWGLDSTTLFVPTGGLPSPPTTIGTGMDLTFSFNVTAPMTSGNHNFQWIMGKNGQAIGTPSSNLAVAVNTQNHSPDVPQGRSAVVLVAARSGNASQWQILNPAEQEIANATTPNGWAMSEAGITAPTTAPIANGYTAIYPGPPPASGPVDTRAFVYYFDVVPAPAVHIALPSWAEHVLPTDSGGSGDASGPSAASSVNLASGVYEHNPGPDIWVRNPKGPDVTFTRSYSSALAQAGKSSPGLPVGWTHEYDLKIEVEATATAPTWNHLKLVYPNGAADTLNLATSAGQPAVWEFTEVAGAPYFVRGEASTTRDVWNWIDVTFVDETTYRFERTQGEAATYRLVRITNPLTPTALPVTTHVLYLKYDSSLRLDAIDVNSSSGMGTALLDISYTGPNGTLSSLQDKYGRTSHYTYTSGNLTQVAGIGTAGGSAGPWQWRYGYVTANAGAGGYPLVNKVSAPEQVSSSAAEVSQTIEYDLDLGYVKALKDANNNRREYTYNPAGQTTVVVKDASLNPVQTFTQLFDNGNKDTGVKDVANNQTSTVYADSVNPFAVTQARNENNQPVDVVYKTLLQSGGYRPVDYVSRKALVNGTEQNVQTQFTYEDTHFRLGRTKSVVHNGDTKATYYYLPNGLVDHVETPRPYDLINFGGGYVTTSYTYTALGNVAEVIMPGPNDIPGPNGFAKYTYGYVNDPGDYVDDPDQDDDTVPSYTKADGEGLGEPVTITDPLGRVTHLRYDDKGRLEKHYDPLGNLTEFQYNNADQIIQVTHPPTGSTGGGRAAETYKYAYEGGPLEQIDFRNEAGTIVRTQKVSTGKEGEGKGVTEGAPLVTLGYDGQYRVKTVADGKNQSTVNTFNSVGDLTHVTFPGQDKIEWPQHDKVGNPLQRKDGKLQLTSYVRSLVDSSVSDIEYTGLPAQKVSYKYDADGRVIDVIDEVSHRAYQYDRLGNLRREDTSYRLPNGTWLLFHITDYAYFPDGSLRGFGGLGIQYDKARNAKTMSTSQSPGVIIQADYDDNNRPLRVEGWGHVGSEEDIVHEYRYNRRGQLLELRNSTALPGNQNGFTYSEFTELKYTPLGELSEMHVEIPAFSDGDNKNPALAVNNGTRPFYSGQAPAGSEYYTGVSKNVNFYYDDKGRMFLDTEGGSYGMDAAGNITSIWGQSYSFNANNQLQSALGEFVYDANGNPTTYQGKTLTYDPENRLRQVSGTGIASPVTYGYRSDGLRAWKEINGVRTYYIYSLGRLVKELKVQNNTNLVTVAIYYWGPDGLFMREGERYTGNLGGIQGYGEMYYTYDPLGNRVHLIGDTDTGKAVLAGHTYGGYGVKQGYFVKNWLSFSPDPGTQVTGTNFYDNNPISPVIINEPTLYKGQAGYYTDAETGLIYCHNRYYDSAKGRWLTRDPIGYAGGINLYAYCDYDPVNGVDPSGLSVQTAASYSAMQLYYAALMVEAEQNREYEVEQHTIEFAQFVIPEMMGVHMGNLLSSSGGSSSRRRQPTSIAQAPSRITSRFGSRLSLGRIRAAGGRLAISRGEVSVRRLAQLARSSGNEIALYRDRASRQLYVTELGVIGGDIPDGTRLILHVHPGSGYFALRPSPNDRAALSQLQQASSLIIDDTASFSLRFGRQNHLDNPINPIVIRRRR